MLEHLDPERFKGQRVGVVYGGSSLERPVSLATGKALASALEGAGFDVAHYDIPEDLGRLVQERPAAVLLGLHGGDGEDGTLQGFLEMLDIPYTGSGVAASVLAMDKNLSKVVMEQAGAPLSPGFLLEPKHFDTQKLLEALDAANMPGPWVLKATDAGSSFGVYPCPDADALSGALVELSKMVDEGQTGGVIVEMFVEGAEYSVGFFDETCLGALEIAPAEGWYDYHAKYESRSTVYTPVSNPEIATALEEAARKAWRALGARGVGRVDVMRRASDGALFVLEANTIPGMTATSLVPKLASSHGISFERFAALMLAGATTDARERGA